MSNTEASLLVVAVLAANLFAAVAGVLAANWWDRRR